jgi:RimJ/RimL family protein N-acetyltransferase
MTSSDSRPAIRKCAWVEGHTLRMRDATVSDAAFTLSLRTDTQKSRYLTALPNDLARQEQWLENYAATPDQAYFIIEDRHGESLGTVRLYDARNASFCWGSWIIKDGVAAAVAIESALMVYAYALDHLRFENAHFDVRKDNTHVWRFHERFGAVRVGETSIDYLYEITEDRIRQSLSRYQKYLPSGVTIGH